VYLDTFKRVILGVIISIIYSTGCTQNKIEIYLNPDGKENYNASEDDPLINLTSAIEEVYRKYPRKDVIIHLQPGEYYLNDPLTINPGLNSLSIIGNSYKDTFIKGSMKLDLSWKRYNKNIWVAKIDEHFDQLFINNEQQILARYPNYNENGGHWQGHAADAISPERIKNWKNPIGAIVHITHKAEWGDFHYVVEGIDKNGEAVLSGGHQNNRPENGLHEKYRMVENVFEELDAPREYFFNKSEKKLFYFPSKGLDLKTAKVEVTVLKHLVEIIGSEQNPVNNVNISGISFSHTKRTIMEEYYKLLRSDWAMYRGGAVLIENAESIEIKNCEFKNLGGNGIFVNKYNRNIKLSENHIHDIGATAISFVGNTSAVRSPSYYYYEYVPFSEMDTVIGPKNNFYPARCIVSDNLIYRTGRIEKQTSGVQISMSMNITVSHNSIYDVPRAGINISEGTWGGHIIEFNDVFNTVLETGDHGSFNSWGRDRFWHPNRQILDSLTTSRPDMPTWDAIHTTVIRNNRFRCDHGWDIDLDDGSSNYYIYNNLCLNGGIKLREGFNRIVENNVMVNNGFHPHVWFKDSKDIFRKNIVMTDHKDIWLKGWGKEVDFNLFPNEEALSKAQSNETDKNSLYGNPKFVNPEIGDFSVEESSSALKLGFKNFSMEDFGVKNKQLKSFAKKPDIPKLHITEFQKVKLNSRKWLSAQIKNVETLGERSAAGLEREEGVLVLKVDKGSFADKAGLQAGDVIVKCDEAIVKKMGDLLSAHQGNNWKGRLHLVVKRNQKEKLIELSTK